MNAAAARAYLKRWELVAEVEREELAATTPAQRFADAEALMGVAAALGGTTHTQQQIDDVRRRWVTLVERLGG